MAKVLSRRLDIAQRTVTVDVEDCFGVLHTHTIPLTGDRCFHCKQAMPGTSGSTNVEATVTAIIASMGTMEDELIAKLEPLQTSEIQRHVQTAKAMREKHRMVKT